MPLPDAGSLNPVQRPVLTVPPAAVLEHQKFTVTFAVNARGVT
jgi:hypothetical protein